MFELAQRIQLCNRYQFKDVDEKMLKAIRQEPAIALITLHAFMQECMNDLYKDGLKFNEEFLKFAAMYYADAIPSLETLIENVRPGALEENKGLWWQIKTKQIENCEDPDETVY